MTQKEAMQDIVLLICFIADMIFFAPIAGGALIVFLQWLQK